MKYFILDTANDVGSLYFKITASNKQSAIDTFCKVESAPESAIKAIYEIPEEYCNFKSDSESHLRLLIRQGIAIKL